MHRFVVPVGASLFPNIFPCLLKEVYYIANFEDMRLEMTGKYR